MVITRDVFFLSHPYTSNGLFDIAFYIQKSFQELPENAET